MIRLRRALPWTPLLTWMLATSPLQARDLTPMAAPETDTASVSTIDEWKPKPMVHPVAAPPATTVTPPATSPSTAAVPTVSPTPAVTQPLTIKKGSLPSEASSTPASPPVKPLPVNATSTPAVTPPLSAVIPETPHIDMNEMKGQVTSVDAGDGDLRISVEGGFNPQFAFDSKTLVTSHGKTLSIDDLVPGDRVTVRYIGQDMTAREIERSNATPAPQPH